MTSPNTLKQSDRKERRTERELESDRRRRRQDGGTNRSRRRGDHFESDWAGRVLLHRYLTGSGDWTIENDPNWSSYMKANESLKRTLRPRVLNLAKTGRSELVNLVTDSFHVSIENGEGILGYQYLHGTNASVGNFQIEGVTTGMSTPKGSTVQLNLAYTWNDIIDPNPIYWTDKIKSAFAELISLGHADGYKIHITWTVENVIEFDANGKIISHTGWPWK